MVDAVEGLVVKEQSGFYWVETPGETVYVCRLRGRLKEEAQSSDIVTIGDTVRIEETPVEGIAELRGVIEEVLPRRSVLSRAVRTAGKRGAGQAEREHVLIANADQVILVFAASQPGPNYKMLDRLLVAGEKSGIENLLIVVNKTDLLEETTAAAELFAPYTRMGYEILLTSAQRGEGIEALRERLRGRISVLTGPSGVGKTSLLNQVQPGLGRAVKAVSQYHQEGVHTTRDSALIKLEMGGYLADTPGIRQIQVWDVEPDELDAYFIDIAEVVNGCRFNNCTHVNEPGCALRAAVDAGQISLTRYENFIELREELRETYIAY